MNVRTVMAIILAIFVLALSIGEEVFLEHTFSQLEDKLESISTEEDLDYAQIKDLENWWLDRHGYLELVLPHTQINEITFTFGELLGAIDAADQKSAIAQYQRLRGNVDAISEMFGFRLGNIF